MPLLHCQLIGKRVWRFRTRHIQDLCGNRWRWRRKREEIVGCVGGEGIRGDCYWWRSRWRRRQVIIWRKSSTGCCGGEGGKYANRMGHRLAAAAEANNNPAVELPLTEAAEVVYKRLWLYTMYFIQFCQQTLKWWPEITPSIFTHVFAVSVSRSALLRFRRH